MTKGNSVETVPANLGVTAKVTAALATGIRNDMNVATPENIETVNRLLAHLSALSSR